MFIAATSFNPSRAIFKLKLSKINIQHLRSAVVLLFWIELNHEECPILFLSFLFQYFFTFYLKINLYFLPIDCLFLKALENLLNTLPKVIVQRTLSAKNISHAKAGCVLASLLKFLPLFLLVFPGMAARVLFKNEVFKFQWLRKNMLCCVFFKGCLFWTEQM